MNNIDINEVALFIETINPILALGITKIEIFEESLKEIEKLNITHEAIGIINSGTYEIKQKELGYRIERLRAIINLLKIYKRSEKDIEEIKQMKNTQRDIDGMFCLGKK